MSRSFARIFCVTLLTLLVGCGRSGPVSAPPASSPPVRGTTTQASKPEAAAANTVPEAAVKAAPPKVEELRLELTVADPGVTGPISHVPESGGWKRVEGDSVVVDGDGLIQPVKPGTAKLVAKTGPDVTANVTFDVRPAEADFSNGILPILTRFGCNSGGCHGRLDGQNGFKLSLFGYAAEQDHRSIVREAGGRRVDVLRPEESLLLLKATGRVPHGGGQAMKPNSADAGRLAAWIASGAPFEGKSPRKVTGVELSRKSVETTAPAKLALHVLATFDDGTKRDVSAWSAWKTLDDRVAKVDTFGRVTVDEPGETHIVARFGSFVSTARIVYAGSTLQEADMAPLAGDSFIDRSVANHLKALGVAPSPQAEDATFLRRVTLDLVGRLPEPAEIRRFVKDQSPDKRAKVVDALLADADFVRYWSLKFGDLLSISSARQGNASAFYLLWLQDRIGKDDPWVDTVRALLTTRGMPASRPDAAAAYSLENADPVAASQLAAQRFLGLRLRCAQCHDHPFDVWTQTQAHEFAAFFAKVRPVPPPPGEAMPRVRIGYFAEGQVVHPLTKSPVAPHVPAGKQPDLPKEGDPLPALAEWITGADNPFFARAYVNWLWSQFFATGLVDPADDLSASNPPSHPQLLDDLANKFRESGYRLKPMIREIVGSRTYGLSSTPTESNRLFARFNAFQSARRLSAQQSADALAQVTGVPNRYANKPTGTRAIDIQDPATASPLLETLGRCDRRDACGTASASQISLRQSLLWIGSDAVDGKVGAVSGYVKQLMDLEPEPDSIVESLYLRTLSRFPNDTEKAHWRETIEKAADPGEIVEDLFWALLNTREFQFVH